MKINILLLLSFVLLLASCYKDDSNDDYKLLSSITIDKEGASDFYSVYQYDRLKIRPVVYREGLDDSKLKYKWEIKDWDVDMVIGDKMELDTIISVPPMTYAYSLLFTVTDETTGISAYKLYEVTVSPILGEGLVVADTRDGGQTSDLSLIMAMNFASGFNDDKSDIIRRDLYSKFNGGKISGPVTGLQNTNYGTNRSLTILTSNDIIRLEPYTYTITDRGNSIFIIPPKPEEIKPQSIAYLGSIGSELLLMNGHVYPRGCQNNNRVYAYYSVTNDVSDYYATHVGPAKTLYNYSANIGGFAFDKLGNRRIIALDNFGENMRLLNSGSDKFDPNNIGKKSCLHIGETKGKIINLLLKDDDQEHYEIYALSCDKKDDGSLPCGRYDMSGCPEIASSRFYEFSMVEDVFYYATEKSIYAVEYLHDVPVPYLRYTVEFPESEKITSMNLWKNNGKIYVPSDDESGKSTISTTNRMMVVSTYNETTKEGKVICLPIATLGIGGIVQDRAFHKTYGGFGKIQCVTRQAK